MGARLPTRFSCRVWVKDAILALHNSHIIVLDKAVSVIEGELLKAAEITGRVWKWGKALLEWKTLIVDSLRCGRK